MSMEGMEKKEKPVPEYLQEVYKFKEMYEVPGQDPVKVHDFERYFKDKKKNYNFFEELSIISKIRSAPKEEQALLIQQGLASLNIVVQKKSAEMIDDYVSDEEQGFLRNIVLQKIKEGLANPDPKIQKASAKMIWCAPYKEQASLIQQGLASLNFVVLEILAERIEYTPHKEQTYLQEILFQKIKDGLNNPDFKIQKALAKMIRYVSYRKEQASLQQILFQKIKDGLNNPNLEIQKASVEMILFISKEKRALLIQEGLVNSKIEVQKASAEMIWSASEVNQHSLREIIFQKIKDGFNDPNFEIQESLAPFIKYIQYKERVFLQKILFQKIKDGLANPDPKIQKASAKMIRYVSFKEQVSLIQQGLTSNNPKVREISAEMIKYVSEEKEQKLLFNNLAMEKGLGKYLIESPLYKNNNVTDKFSRTKFEKTGSETILIGGELKDKTILRKITPEAFLAWQKLYEDYNLWKDAGFDYVPIEPIQSFDVNENGLVDVYSGVLDLNFEEWIKRTSMFKYELETQAEKIEEVLDSKNIIHGHTHNENFCLRFFRDEKGEPDFKRMPRVYLIDFDQAVSLGN